MLLGLRLSERERDLVVNLETGIWFGECEVKERGRRAEHLRG